MRRAIVQRVIGLIGVWTLLIIGLILSDPTWKLAHPQTIVLIVIFLCALLVLIMNKLARK